jgi:hypothetical protein
MIGNWSWIAMTNRSLLPNRRWLQFRLRTLVIVMTLAAVSFGWWRHRSYCLERAQDHGRREFMADIMTRFGLPTGWEDPQHSETRRQYKRLRDYHHALRDCYHLAVWQPWLRFWIDDSLPPSLVEMDDALVAPIQ